MRQLINPFKTIDDLSHGIDKDKMKICDNCGGWVNINLKEGAVFKERERCYCESDNNSTTRSTT